MNLCEDLMKALGPLPSKKKKKKSIDMESCNITLKGSCNPGSILIDNEKEEPCLFIINMVVRGTLHFETNSLWFSGRPSLDTRVRTKISLFLFLRFDFASLMCLHPSIGMILSVEHTHKARRLSERVCRGIQEGGETITLRPQSNQEAQHLQGLILDQSESEKKKLWARVLPFIAFSGENRTRPGKQST